MDVSNCSHEEAVQVFLNAEEPITVEVKRRSAAAENEQGNDLGASPLRNVPVVVGKPRSVSTSSVGVQTEEPTGLQLERDDDLVFDESPVSDQIVNIFDECLVPDVDFEVS